MNKVNYQKILDGIISNLQKTNTVPTLLLHVCCAPCSSYCLEYLSQYFKITVFFYNPNISERAEYQHRLKEEKRFISEMNFKYPVNIIEGEYSPLEYFSAVKGLENEPEGGERCKKCFELRLEKSARIAREMNFDYFTTTLTISPLKNAPLLNQIGERFADVYDVKWLNSDFKKKEGYKRSIVLSAEHNLYRQNYCGCVFSKREAAEKE